MTSRTKLGDEVGISVIRGDYFGIEVEVEQCLTEYDPYEQQQERESLSTDEVLCVHDGSLRDQGCEFIFRRPLAVQSEDFSTAVDYIQAACTEAEAVGSFRTSTHFHMNMTDMTLDQIRNLVFLSLVVEPALLKHCSEHRNNNRFCVPWSCDSEMQQLFRSHNRLGTLASRMHDRSKYAATSLHRMVDLGTIEYRMFDAIWDAEVLRKIARFFTSIRRIAMTKTIDEIRDDKVQGRLLDQMSRLIRDCFGEKVQRTELQDLLTEGADTAINLVECTLDRIKLQEMQNALAKKNPNHELEHGEDSSCTIRTPDSRPTEREALINSRVTETMPVPPPAPSSELGSGISSRWVIPDEQSRLRESSESIQQRREQAQIFQDVIRSWPYDTVLHDERSGSFDVDTTEPSQGEATNSPETRS